MRMEDGTVALARASSENRRNRAAGACGSLRRAGANPFQRGLLQKHAGQRRTRRKLRQQKGKGFRHDIRGRPHFFNAARADNFSDFGLWTLDFGLA